MTARQIKSRKPRPNPSRDDRHIASFRSRAICFLEYVERRGNKTINAKGRLNVLDKQLKDDKFETWDRMEWNNQTVIYKTKLRR